MPHTTVRQKIEIPFQYTAGPAVQRFLEGLKDRKIIAGVCPSCGFRSLPPLSFCGRCWQATSFETLSGKAVLQSFTHVGQEIFGLIKFDGADSTLAHRIVANEGSLKPGAPVEPVWRSDRSASILDIEHFRTLPG